MVRLSVSRGSPSSDFSNCSASCGNILRSLATGSLRHNSAGRRYRKAKESWGMTASSGGNLAGWLWARAGADTEVRIRTMAASKADSADGQGTARQPQRRKNDMAWSFLDGSRNENSAFFRRFLDRVQTEQVRGQAQDSSPYVFSRYGKISSRTVIISCNLP